MTNYYHTPYFVDLIRYPSIKVPQFKVPVAEQYRQVYTRENIYVPQSPVGMSSFFGTEIFFAILLFILTFVIYNDKVMSLLLRVNEYLKYLL